MNDSAPRKIRLTAFSHGGGCGCKVAPALLAEILRDQVIPFPIPKELLVGVETSDDAAVYQINETQAVVATTDFFTPIVDDPFDFGRIAATNALSDVYAMGGTPIFALAIVGMPIDKLPPAVISSILAGGQSVCREAGIPIAGGHTIDVAEPIYGLVVIGLVAPDHITRNRGAQAGDVLILGKPLGVGVLTAALKRERLSEMDYATLLKTTTQLNTPGTQLALMAGVHAMTDVTGFGLIGHLLEICRASDVSAHLEHGAIPFFESAMDLASQGFVTGASKRNWNSYHHAVEWPAHLAPVWEALLTDPQTSGGLLVSCASKSADDVLNLFRSAHFDAASVIGRVDCGPSRVTVR